MAISEKGCLRKNGAQTSRNVFGGKEGAGVCLLSRTVPGKKEKSRESCLSRVGKNGNEHPVKGDFGRGPEIPSVQRNRPLGRLKGPVPPSGENCRYTGSAGGKNLRKMHYLGKKDRWGTGLRVASAVKWKL